MFMNLKKLKKNLIISQFQFSLFSNPIFSIIKKNNLDSFNSKNIYKYSTNKLIVFSLLGLDLIKFPIAVQKFKSYKCIEKLDFNSSSFIFLLLRIYNIIFRDCFKHIVQFFLYNKIFEVLNSILNIYNNIVFLHKYVKDNQN